MDTCNAHEARGVMVSERNERSAPRLEGWTDIQWCNRAAADAHERGWVTLAKPDWR